MIPVSRQMALSDSQRTETWINWISYMEQEVPMSISHLLCSLLQLTDLDVFVPWLALLY